MSTGWHHNGVCALSGGGGDCEGKWWSPDGHFLTLSCHPGGGDEDTKNKQTHQHTRTHTHTPTHTHLVAVHGLALGLRALLLLGRGRVISHLLLGSLDSILSPTYIYIYIYIYYIILYILYMCVCLCIGKRCKFGRVRISPHLLLGSLDSTLSPTYTHIQNTRTRHIYREREREREREKTQRLMSVYTPNPGQKHPWRVP